MYINLDRFKTIHGLDKRAALHKLGPAYEAINKYRYVERIYRDDVVIRDAEHVDHPIIHHCSLHGFEMRQSPGGKPIEIFETCPLVDCRFTLEVGEACRHMVCTRLLRRYFEAA
jgi:hypothetical protein